MKRTLILIGVLALVAGVYFFTGDENDAKVDAIMAERNFAIPEDDIEKVIITQKDGTVNTLTNKGELWYINGNRINRNQKFLVSEALTKVRINSIPPKGATKAIMQGIAKIGILVRVYGKGDKLLRSYYVGGVPQGERGTYYLMEGYSQPYLVEIPGMEGSTRGRFVKKPTDWLDRAMFRFPKKNIDEITIEYPRSKEDSYKLSKESGDFIVEPLFSFTKKMTTPQNDRLIEDYLANYYKGFFTEAYVNDMPKRDSIIQYMSPFCKMRITDSEGEITSLDFYPFNEVFDNPGNALGPDVDKFIERYYVNVNSGENFMLTQQILAKKFLWGYNYFFR